MLTAAAPPVSIAAEPGRFRTVMADGQVTLVENRLAKPRAWVAAEATYTTAAAAPKLLRATPGRWADVLAPEREFTGHARMAELFGALPVALLERVDGDGEGDGDGDGEGDGGEADGR